MDVLDCKYSSISSLDIIVPVYNEENCIDEFVARVRGALSDKAVEYNLLFINDGSTDKSIEIIKNVCDTYENFYYISFSRNFGKESALTAGLDYCYSDAVAIIDADLQDPPELIPEMMRVLQAENVDIVYAKRRIRKGENWLKKTTATFFYLIFDCISRFEFPRDTGDFRIVRKRVVTALKRIDEKNRFMKGLFAWVGFRQVAFIYDREPRSQGETKFNFLKLFTFAIDGITAFTTAPLKVATYVGLSFSLLALLYGLYFLAKTLIWGDPVPGFPSLIVSLSFFSGVQLMFLGIIGEYIARIHREVKGRPLYIIDEMSCKEKK